MANSSDNCSLLLFRVGPVLCCAPSLPVLTIIPPPELTRPPGSDPAKPGIFKYSGQIVSSLDLRYKFGVDEEQWANPGRVVITQIKPGCVGFWVDEIQEVMETPDSGWGALPPLLPRGIFSQTLLLNKKIYLYAEFDNLYKIPTSGYLRVYIEHLLEQQRAQSQPQTNNKQHSTASTLKTAFDKNDCAISNKTTAQKSKTKSSGKEQQINNLSPKPDVPPTKQPTSESSSTTSTDLKSIQKDINRDPTDASVNASALSQSHDQAKANNKPISLNKSDQVVEPNTSKPNLEQVTSSKLTNENLSDPKTTEHKPGLAEKYDQQQFNQIKSAEKHTDNSQDANRAIHENNPFSKESAQQINNVSQAKTDINTNSTQLNHSQSTTKEKSGHDQSIGFGFFLVIFLVLATIPGLVWYISDSSYNDSGAKTVTFNKLNSNRVNKTDTKKSLDNENTTHHKLTISNTDTENTVTTDSVKNKLTDTTSEIKTDPSANNPDENDEVQNQDKSTDTSLDTILATTTDTTADITADTDIDTSTNSETQTTDTNSNQAQAIHSQSTSEEKISTDSTSATEHGQSDYHAEIKSDDAGITIILEAPEESPVFKLESQIETNTSSTAENHSPPTKNTDRETDIELTVETKPTPQASTAPSTKLDAEQPINTITRTEIIHIVVKGDTLWHIAIRYVNNPYKYPELARLSNIKNPDLIYPGNRVRIIKKSRQSP